MCSLCAVLIGFGLDMLFGDPNFSLHPIRLIGKLIEVSERIIRSILPKNKSGELFGGIIIVIVVCAVSTGIVHALLVFFYDINTILGLAVESIFCWFFVAAKSLKTESMKVYNELKKGDIASSRRTVSMIVGRDTERLDFEGVAKAAVETVAENTSDGVVAPIIFMMIGGAPLGALYKAINTMDSMVGYKNSKYLYFGRAAAKLDDIANFIPSRISGIAMIMASAVLGMDYKNAAKIFKRDRLKHKSPNSAQTEAACAGALGIRLAGDAWYFGELYKKDYIGDALNEVIPEHILMANRLMYTTSAIVLIIFGLIKFAFAGGII
ncbi:MAG: adenosylcobinamide-phosphate synthase CbiB [Clostridiales bacterium]|nr:adenosylcobinamide-phosphate synthase CbiB [Clostridiales bacterium]